MKTLPETLPWHGLSMEEAQQRQQRYGANTIYTGVARTFLRMLWEVVREPMFLILALVCALYFLLGSVYEGQVMLFAMALVVAISLYQEMRSTSAIKSLRQYTQGKVRTLRARQETLLPAEELVPDDIIILSEGDQIPADAEVLKANDLAVNEAIMTGESVAVDKIAGNILLQGATITAGMCYARVRATGSHTELARLGKRMEDVGQQRSLLQAQVNRFVRHMALAGLLAFILVFGINYFATNDLIISLLFGLVMTMSLIPEEIPVAFTSFMAIGAYRMSRIGLLVRQPVTVESLGSASVICLDKTGTITENRMQLAAIYDYTRQQQITAKDFIKHPENEVISYAMWASEPHPFDPMEIALHEAYAQHTREDERPLYQMIQEYPLEGKPPVMTHVWERHDQQQIVACKGGVERVLRMSRLPASIETDMLRITEELAAVGYRILGVAKALSSNSDFPVKQDDFDWQFLGLVALYDPPKPGIQGVLAQFYEAGIQVKMLTGDYPQTALTIANESGLQHNGRVLTGETIMQLPAEALQQTVQEVDVFARMFPEAKLQVIEALKSSGEVVAMTGDGVNDGPALKAAHIGVAMGSQGADIAKKAASLIITDDRLDKMIDAIANGRKIYANLKKAIRYIISIHIPIIFTVLMPLLLNWDYKNIFTPVHVIFLEMIMGPTCSIFFENEPMETGLMQRRPRPISEALFSWQELSGSILQGVIIALGVLGVYYWAMQQGYTESMTRTMTFITLIISNICLTLVNRSFDKSILVTIRYHNHLLPIVLVASGVLLLVLQFVPFVRDIFQLQLLNLHQWLLCAATALLSTGWLEVYKIFRKQRAF
jgi:Ca2+-transporting ATPase